MACIRLLHDDDDDDEVFCGCIVVHPDDDVELNVAVDDGSIDTR